MLVVFGWSRMCFCCHCARRVLLMEHLGPLVLLQCLMGVPVVRLYPI
jgi:hypothetical protein